MAEKKSESKEELKLFFPEVLEKSELLVVLKEVSGLY